MMVESDTSTKIETADTTVAEPAIKPHLILALDYGVKKMGMALGNTITGTARAFDILAMNNGQPDWDNLIGIIKEFYKKIGIEKIWLKPTYNPYTEPSMEIYGNRLLI